MELSNLFNTAKSTPQSFIQPFEPQKKLSMFFPKTEQRKVYELKDRGIQITDEDLAAARPLIYGETSNRTPDKQELEAHVIMNTALNRMREYAARGQKKTLSEVLSMPNQYQAYGGQQYQIYHNPIDVPSQQKKKNIDSIVDKIGNQIKSGQYPDTTQGAYFYIHNPDQTITYDNKKQLFAK